MANSLLHILNTTILQRKKMSGNNRNGTTRLVKPLWDKNELTKPQKGGYLLCFYHKKGVTKPQKGGYLFICKRNRTLLTFNNKKPHFWRGLLFKCFNYTKIPR